MIFTERFQVGISLTYIPSLQASEYSIPMHHPNAYPHPYGAQESQNPNPIAPTQSSPMQDTPLQPYPMRPRSHCNALTLLSPPAEPPR
jgi:hypothetical protein